MSQNPSEETARRAEIPQRPIDQAMAEERNEKTTMRNLWLDLAKEMDAEYPTDDVPLYTTLCGAEARDIRLLAQHNLIEMTEVGGIASSSQSRVIAVERSEPAVLNLQRELPGLTILAQDFSSIIRGSSSVAWPDNAKERRACRARIVNLDLQGLLNADIATDGHVTFPILAWVKKLCALHSLEPRKDWCLCLTLNGAIKWPIEASKATQEFLAENFDRVPDFGEACYGFLGDDLYKQMSTDTTVDYSTLPKELQQKVLMALVPKKIAHSVHEEGWHVQTRHNLYYGGTDNHAPMVSWILCFGWDAHVAHRPNYIYGKSLASVFSSAGFLGPDGQIIQLPLQMQRDL